MVSGNCSLDEGVRMDLSGGDCDILILCGLHWIGLNECVESHIGCILG